MAEDFKIRAAKPYWSRLAGSLIGALNANQEAEPVSPTNPLPVAVMSGGTGGGTAPAAPLRVLGSQELTLTAAAQALTVPAGASYAEIQVQGGDARVRYDGTAPTATSGKVWSDLSVWEITTLAELQAFRAVIGSGAPALDITYKGA